MNSIIDIYFHEWTRFCKMKHASSCRKKIKMKKFTQVLSGFRAEKRFSFWIWEGNHLVLPHFSPIELWRSACTYYSHLMFFDSSIWFSTAKHTEDSANKWMLSWQVNLAKKYDCKIQRHAWLSHVECYRVVRAQNVHTQISAYFRCAVFKQNVKN